jgi:large repetitive protein
VTFASDDAGNTSGTTFHVTVRDTTPPTLTVADDQVAEATSPHGAAVIGELSAARQRTTDGEVEAFLAPSEARS